MGFPGKPNYARKAFGFLGLPLHVDFIWNRGAYIIEILNLDELAKDRAYQFLFVVGPLRLQGGIGVPVNPVAILYPAIGAQRSRTRDPFGIAVNAQSAVLLREVKKVFPLHGGRALEVLDLEHL